MKISFRLAIPILLAAVAAHAETPDVASLAAQLRALKAQMSALEGKLAAQQSESHQIAGTSAAGSSAKSGFDGLDGVSISGFVDSSYSYNFNSPSSGTSVGRVFDHDSNSFSVNAAKLAIQKAISNDNPVGFRADLYAGNDSELIHSAGLGTSSESVDLEQAYVETNVPLSKGISGLNDLNIKFGKFVTLAGAEVIESKDNWNYSRSLLFGYAIPFTHTGARATYAWDNGWDLALGINNGWDLFDDNNDSKTLEAHFGFNNIALPYDSSATIALQGYVGPELEGNNSGQRTLGDIVVTYKTPWKPLTFLYNFDYANQEDANGPGDSANWYGHAGYFRYELDDQWSVSGRGEFFRDDDGYRIVAGTPATYREFTATVEYRPWKNIITRLEFRNDRASKDVFDDGDAKSNTQDTLGGELIYLF